MKTLQLFLFIFISSTLFAQVEIAGIVADENNNPLMGANVYIKGR